MQGYLPQLSSSMIPITSVIPAGIRSENQRISRAPYGPGMLDRTSSKRNSEVRRSVTAMKKSRTNSVLQQPITETATKKPAKKKKKKTPGQRGKSQNQRRQLGIPLSTSDENALSAIPRNPTDYTSNMGGESFFSPTLSSVSPPARSALNTAKRNSHQVPKLSLRPLHSVRDDADDDRSDLQPLDSLGQRRQSTAAAQPVSMRAKINERLDSQQHSDTRSAQKMPNQHYKLTRYLNKVQKQRQIDSPDPQGRNHATGANPALSLPLIPAGNRLYDDFRRGKATQRETTADSKNVLHQTQNSQFYTMGAVTHSNTPSPDIQRLKSSRTGLTRATQSKTLKLKPTMTKKVSMPTIDRRLKNPKIIQFGNGRRRPSMEDKALQGQLDQSEFERYKDVRLFSENSPPKTVSNDELAADMHGPGMVQPFLTQANPIHGSVSQDLSPADIDSDQNSSKRSDRDDLILVRPIDQRVTRAAASQEHLMERNVLSSASPLPLARSQVSNEDCLVTEFNHNLAHPHQQAPHFCAHTNFQSFQCGCQQHSSSPWHAQSMPILPLSRNAGNSHNHNNSKNLRGSSETLLSKRHSHVAPEFLINRRSSFASQSGSDLGHQLRKQYRQVTGGAYQGCGGHMHNWHQQSNRQINGHQCQCCLSHDTTVVQGVTPAPHQSQCFQCQTPPPQHRQHQHSHSRCHCQSYQRPSQQETCACSVHQPAFACNQTHINQTQHHIHNQQYQVHTCHNCGNLDTTFHQPQQAPIQHQCPHHGCSVQNNLNCTGVHGTTLPAHQVHYVTLPNVATLQSHPSQEDLVSATSPTPQKAEKRHKRADSLESLPKPKGTPIAIQTDEPFVSEPRKHTQNSGQKSDRNDTKLDIREKSMVSINAEVQTEAKPKEVRVIETQTDPPQKSPLKEEKKLLAPRKQPPELKVSIVDSSGSFPSKKQSPAKKQKRKEEAPKESPSPKQPNRVSPLKKKQQAAIAPLEESNTQEKITPQPKPPKVPEKAKLKKGSLPPADILFDHLDRVSQRLTKVKSLAIVEESLVNASFASKGSFRHPVNSSSKKRGFEGSHGTASKKSNEKIPANRMGTFGTDNDSDSEGYDYMGNIDTLLQREKDTQRTLREVRNTHKSRLEDDQTAVVKRQSGPMLVGNPKQNLDKFFVQEDPNYKQSSARQTENRQEFNISDQHQTNHLAADFKTPEKETESFQGSAGTMLSPIGRLVGDGSQNSNEKEGSPRIQIVDNNEPILVRNEYGVRKYGSSVKQELKASDIDHAAQSARSAVQNTSPSKLEVNERLDDEGIQTSPHRIVDNNILSEVGRIAHDGLVSDKMSSCVNIQQILVDALDGSRTEQPHFNGKKKSILKSPNSGVLPPHKTAQLHEPAINKIDEDSSEEWVPSSEERAKKQQAPKGKKKLAINTTKVTFDRNVDGRVSSDGDLEEEEDITDVQMGEAMKGIRQSIKKKGLVLQEQSSENSSVHLKIKKRKRSNSVQSGSSGRGRNSSSCLSSDIHTSGQSSDSSYDSESDHETRASFIDRMRQERMRIVAQSANKVPEMYQYYFQNDDNEDNDGQATSGKKRKRDSSENRSGNISGNRSHSKGRDSGLGLSEPSSVLSRANTMMGGGRRKKKAKANSGKNKKKLMLKRQSTLMEEPGSATLQNALHIPVLAINEESGQGSSGVTPAGSSSATTPASGLQGFSGRSKNSDQLKAAFQSPDRSKISRSQQRKKRGLNRGATVEVKDMSKALHDELKSVSKNLGLYGKKQKSFKLTSRRSSIVSSSTQNEEKDYLGLKLKKKISYGNGTIRELPGLEGGTSHNSPNPSPQPSPHRVGLNDDEPFFLNAIAEELKEDQNTTHLRKEPSSASVREPVYDTASTNQETSTDGVQAQNKLVRKSIKKIVAAQTHLNQDLEHMDEVTPLKPYIEPSQEGAKPTKTFLKRKPQPPFLAKRLKHEASRAQAGSTTDISVYKQPQVVLADQTSASAGPTQQITKRKIVLKRKKPAVAAKPEWE